jgi:hypothetical protein
MAECMRYRSKYFSPAFFSEVCRSAMAASYVRLCFSLEVKKISDRGVPDSSATVSMVAW